MSEETRAFMRLFQPTQIEILRATKFHTINANKYDVNKYYKKLSDGVTSFYEPRYQMLYVLDCDHSILKFTEFYFVYCGYCAAILYEPGRSDNLDYVKSWFKLYCPSYSGRIPNLENCK